MAEAFSVRFEIPAAVATDARLRADYMALVWPREERIFRRMLTHGPAQPVTPWEWEVTLPVDEVVHVVGSCTAERR